MPFDDDFASAAAGDMLSELGGTVARWPDGVEDDVETVEGAVWEPDPVGMLQASRDGEKTTLRGTLTVAEAQAVERRDSWLINGEFYRVEHIVDAVGGLKNVRLVKVEKTITNRTIDRR